MANILVMKASLSSPTIVGMCCLFGVAGSYLIGLRREVVATNQKSIVVGEKVPEMRVAEALEVAKLLPPPPRKSVKNGPSIILPAKQLTKPKHDRLQWPPPRGLPVLHDKTENSSTGPGGYDLGRKHIDWTSFGLY